MSKRNGLAFNSIQVPLAAQASMTEHVNEWILCGSDDALGHLRLVVRKTLMHAGHHHVQFRQQAIVKIQAAAGQNINFGACQ